MGLVRSIGVSSRLDESLVGELDNRAEIKVKQLQKNGTKPPGKDTRVGLRFQRNHETQFARMESIDTCHLNTPKRHANEEQGANKKRIKREPQSPSQISEITKRIRRLRIKNNHDNSTHVRETKLTAQRPMEPPKLTSNNPAKASKSVFDRLYAPKTLPKSTSLKQVRAPPKTLIKSETNKTLARPTWR